MKDVFTIEEIIYYLKTQDDISDAICNLNTTNILNSMPVEKFNPFTCEKNDKNLKRVEEYIGMDKLKTYQRKLYRTTNGREGRCWMSLSPRWIENRFVTDFSIGYWVNYGDDQTYGFFTVEQILEWFNNPSIKLYEIGGIKER